MKYLVIFLILIGFANNAFAQNIDNSEDKMWLPACTKGSQTECDQASLFHSAISKPFAQSDSVAIGTIIEKEIQGQNTIQYLINVDFYLKNHQPFELLTATLNDAPELQTFPDVLYYNSPVFNKGDLVFVYLVKTGGQYEILPVSFALDKHEARGPPPTILLTKNPDERNFEQGDDIFVSGEVRKMELVKAAKNGSELDVKVSLLESNDRNNITFSDQIGIEPNGSYSYYLNTSKIPPGSYELEVNYGPSTTGDEISIATNWKIWTPLKQFKAGIDQYQIKCKSDFYLVYKYNGSPACVLPESISKLIERGWTKDGSVLSKINTGCMTIEQSKQIASFFKTPTYLPEGYSHVCSRSGMPFESYIVYYNQEFPNNWQIPELVNEGAIFIYQIDERNLLGAEKFETFGTAEQRIQETYDSVMDGNPSLNPQLITINGILAYAVDSCPDCGMQTANFTDGTFIQKNTSTETKIKFIDENGIKYMLETTLPLQELIKVAESLQ